MKFIKGNNKNQAHHFSASPEQAIARGNEARHCGAYETQNF